jgi:hypothetical protein
MLKRSIENLTQSPLELGSVPWVAAHTIKHNMEIDDYTTAQKVLVGPFGFLWISLPQVGLAAGRAAAGALEFPLGLLSVFTRREAAPLLDLEHAPAMVDRPGKYYHLKFGILIAARDVESPEGSAR